MEAITIEVGQQPMSHRFFFFFFLFCIFWFCLLVLLFYNALYWMMRMADSSRFEKNRHMHSIFCTNDVILTGWCNQDASWHSTVFVHTVLRLTNRFPVTISSFFWGFSIVCGFFFLLHVSFAIRSVTGWNTLLFVALSTFNWINMLRTSRNTSTAVSIY